MKHPLWPDDVPSGPNGSGAAAGAGSGPGYLVLPSVDDPRLVIPTRPRRSSLTVLHALRDRSSLTARARTAAMSATALLDARSHVLPTPTLFEVVAERLRRPTRELVIGVHLGPPRANRKPVLAVADRRGALLAFVKYGVDPLTDALVAVEAGALSTLADAVASGRLQHCTVPTLVAVGRHDGHDYAIQTPVPTSALPTSPRRAAADLVAAAQREVAEVYVGTPEASQHEGSVAAIAERWRARAETSTDPVVTSFAALAATWTELADADPPRWGSWHGDWRTTNMSVTRHGCSVWDWERFSSGVPVGYDALHLFLTTRLPSVDVLAGLPYDVLENAPRLLRPFDVSTRKAADLTVAGYFLELAGRYLDDGQEAAGARLGAVGEWLLPALDQLVHSHASTRGGTQR